MKTTVLKTIASIAFNCFAGALVATLLGLPTLLGMAALNIVAILAGCAPKRMALRAGIYSEIWTGEIVKALRGGMEGSWLDGITDNSSIVNNDEIHLVEAGVDPDVLIDNTSYPIDTQALDDTDITIQLNRFQSKPTPITDDELYAISYDKMARVKESHANAINDAKFIKAAHNLCAAAHTAKTPILSTSGNADADTGRKQLTPEDLVSMKRAMDKLKVPPENRRLVLCPDHVNDLLAASQNFREQYNIDRNTGKVGRLYGFEMYEYAGNPLYTTAKAKKDIGSTAATGEYQCSFAFYTPRVFKATGSTKMYYSEAVYDPQNQRNLINFRHYFICLMKKADAGVVITSAQAS